MELLIIDGVDITHFRLVELAGLADQARPFYDWVESRFQNVLSRSTNLESLLYESSEDEIRMALEDCYDAAGASDIPFLFDGVGRSYPHSKACYYFFAWLIRDAPQQRLGPLIQRIVQSSRKTRIEAEITALSALICKYRSNVKTFSWDAIREVLIDRLEGSRRSIKGHEKETVVRTALLKAIQSYFVQHGNYGVFAGIEIPDGQVTVGNETYDISANLLGPSGQRLRRILIPIKTRETEGGGHAHLFSRDILSAISAARFDNADDYIVVIIVAMNWSYRETENLREIVDHIAVFNLSPGEFTDFGPQEQEVLNSFVSGVLDGTSAPKSGVAR